MTRSKTKALKETMNVLVLKAATKSELQGPLEYQEETLVMQTKELDILIIHSGMRLNSYKTFCHFQVAQL